MDGWMKDVSVDVETESNKLTQYLTLLISLNWWVGGKLTHQIMCIHRVTTKNTCNVNTLNKKRVNPFILT